MQAAYQESRMTGGIATRERDTLYRLFAQNAEAQFSAPALRSLRGDIDYRALRDQAERLSVWMLNAGVRRSDRIAFVCDRSGEAIAAHLAALRIGAVCVPLDASSPSCVIADHIAQATPILVLRDAEGDGPGVMLKDALAQAQAMESEPLACDEAITANDPAFIMFTSGSTGRAKGVIIPHRAIVRLVHGQDYARFGADTVFLHASAANFDASLLEVWAPLLNGGVCAVLETPRPGLDEVAHAIEHMNVREAWLTSGVFNLMVDYRAEALSRLRLLISGGDVLSVSHVKRALATLPKTRLVNGYGPTENTTFTTCHVFTRDGWGDGPAPIGLPLNGTRVHLLDEGMRPVAAGDVGRLWVGGSGVALGYLGQPELTQQKFRPDHFSDDENALLYDTGDFASVRSDGAFLFHGRADRQIKLNGVRIELDGLEAIAASAPDVRAAAVVARAGDNGDKHLEAYVVLQEFGDLERVRRYLREHLPSAMAPGVLVELSQLPLTSQGKVDRAALRRAEVKETAPSSPQNVAAHIARIWADVLGREASAVNASFFALGGTSLQLLRVHVLLETSFGRMPLAALFDNPTIELQARLLEGMSSQTALASESQERAASAREARARMKARRGEADR